MIVKGAAPVRGRGTLVWFTDAAFEPGPHDQMRRGAILRRADGATWKVLGVETMGYRRTGAVLLETDGQLAPDVGDELAMSNT